MSALGKRESADKDSRARAALADGTVDRGCNFNSAAPAACESRTAESVYTERLWNIDLRDVQDFCRTPRDMKDDFGIIDA